MSGVARAARNGNKDCNDQNCWSRPRKYLDVEDECFKQSRERVNKAFPIKKRFLHTVPARHARHQKHDERNNDGSAQRSNDIATPALPSLKLFSFSL
jgi:hypothetical protein